MNPQITRIINLTDFLMSSQLNLNGTVIMSFNAFRLNFHLLDKDFTRVFVVVTNQSISSVRNLSNGKRIFCQETEVSKELAKYKDIHHIYTFQISEEVIFGHQAHKVMVLSDSKSPKKIKQGKIDFNLRSDEYHLIGHGSCTDCGVLYYRRNLDGDRKCQETTGYLNVLREVITLGTRRPDRTGTGVISKFGTQVRFDISKSIPVLTTKNVSFINILEELLWICRGDTDAKLLSDKKVRIWEGNTTREFLDSVGLKDYPVGTLGPGYGWQMRHQGAKYDVKFSDTSEYEKEEIGGFDQLQYVIDTLKNDPYSRRIVLSYWNPSDFSKTALLPCHVLLQFYVEPDPNDPGCPWLSCMFTMRSSDVFLAHCYNVVSYSVLTYILAKKCGMKPKEIVYSVGDYHVYTNHLEQVNTQLKRTPRPFRQLQVSDSVIDKTFHEMNRSDFELIGYFPHPSITAPMAI
jgi:thymidylate synthase